MAILGRKRRDEVATVPPPLRESEASEAPHLSKGSPLDVLLDKAVTIPSSSIHAHVATLRRRNPYASPAQIIGLLEKEYLLVVSAAGGAVGAAAAAPFGGTGTAIGLTAGDVATFFAASSAFALAVADVHGIEVEDAARRRALLLTTVLGEEGAKELAEAIEIGSATAATTLLTRLPTSTINAVNGTLTRRVVRRQAARRTTLLMGRLVPFGIGAWIGFRGARSLGHTVIDGARAAFGPPPAVFPRVIEVIETGGIPRLVPADRPGEGTSGR
jgi:hypothetical protein